MAELQRRGDTPTRTPERQALADAIANHREATDAVTKVTEAQDRLRTDLGEARSALTMARAAYEDAKAEAPGLLVLALTGEEGGAAVADIAETEAATALEHAEQRVEHARQARQLLDRELANREKHLHLAEHDLDAAVQAAVNADPVKQAALEAFFREGRHVLRLAQVLRTMHITVTGVDNDEVGLALRLLDQTRPGTQGQISAFTPDGAFAVALANLRADPIAPLPDLPTREPVK